MVSFPKEEALGFAGKTDLENSNLSVTQASAFLVKLLIKASSF